MKFKVGDKIVRVKDLSGTNKGQFKVGDTAVIIYIHKDGTNTVTNAKIKKDPPNVKPTFEGFAIEDDEISLATKLHKALL